MSETIRLKKVVSSTVKLSNTQLIDIKNESSSSQSFTEIKMEPEFRPQTVKTPIKNNTNKNNDKA